MRPGTLSVPSGMQGVPGARFQPPALPHPTRSTPINALPPVLACRCCGCRVSRLQVPRFRAVHEEVIKLDQDFGATFSGCLTDTRGRVRALWGSYAEQVRPRCSCCCCCAPPPAGVRAHHNVRGQGWKPAGVATLEGGAGLGLARIKPCTGRPPWPFPTMHIPSSPPSDVLSLSRVGPCRAGREGGARVVRRPAHARVPALGAAGGQAAGRGRHARRRRCTAWRVVSSCGRWAGQPEGGWQGAPGRLL